MKRRHVIVAALAAAVSGGGTLAVTYSLGETDRRAADELRCRSEAAVHVDEALSDLLVEIGDLIERSLSGAEPSEADRAELLMARDALREANDARRASLVECAD